MTKIEPKILKGFRDFLPLELTKRKYVLNTLKEVFELYGFEQLETPSLEYEEILTGKYGDEGDKLMYKFEDNGKRKVALRYDQTVPLARVAAQYQNKLPIPFKRYQLQNVWRAENTQRGRYREFLQVDADIIGTYSPLADTEIILTVAECLKRLRFENFTIRINDRGNFKDINPRAVAIVDKLNKIGFDAVKSELKENNFSEDLLSEISNKPAPDKVNTIMKIVCDTNENIKNKIKYEATLARGLDYYTGIIFEVEVKGYEAGSIAGGGRYDNLIGIFAGKEIPAVGFSFGFDRIMEAIEDLNLFPENLRESSVMVAFENSDLQQKALKITTQLRNGEINSELYLEDATLEKQLKYADRKNIPYVVIAEENNLILKNMKKRTQEILPLEKIIKELK